jgi:hypothetical protein
VETAARFTTRISETGPCAAVAVIVPLALLVRHFSRTGLSQA